MYMNFPAGVKLQAVQNRAGAVRCSKRVQHNSLFWAGQELPQTFSVLSRHRLHQEESGLCCPAGIWPPSAGTYRRSNHSFRTRTAQNPALCPVILILPCIRSVYGQEIVDLNVEVLKYIDVTISGLFS